MTKSISALKASSPNAIDSLSPWTWLKSLTKVSYETRRASLTFLDVAVASRMLSNVEHDSFVDFNFKEGDFAVTATVFLIYLE